LSGPGSYYAIVTGASAGLGRAFAEELARRGHNLLLVSLPGTGLPELSASLEEKHNATVKYMETDLMRLEAPRELLAFVRQNNIAVDILVNNVGIGHGGGIGQYSDEAIEESVFLNMRCTTQMTNLFIGELRLRERAYILNIGSFGGFIPLPYKSIYSATKSYIYHFSLAVRDELRGSGVSVSVAMPGGIITNDRVRERIREKGFVARANSIEPDKAADYVVERMLRGKAVIITGRTMRIAYLAGGLLPFRLLMLITGKLFRGIN
jgi:short-subunit dehydrogenase